MHSTVSDGTDSPAELIGRVKETGIGLFALTDHDAIKGCAQLAPRLSAGDPAFLSGVEFGCKDDFGKYHILGYGYEPAAPSIQEVVALGHAYRMQKARARLDGLKTVFGFTFPQFELDALLALDNPGKPHIGNLMVKYGYAESKERAIKDYINQLHVETRYVRPEEAIAGILGAGGIPVLAHPCYGSGDQTIVDDEMARRLERLMDFGLQGVEAFYSGFSPKLRNMMLDFAERYGLYVTAGSDYHGENKLVRLGDTGLDEVPEWPEGLKRFLQAVRPTHGDPVELISQA